MYFVDRSKIEETLNYMDKLLNEIQQEAYQTFEQKLFLERSVHMVIESILDTGNMMIDGFIMRDPGSYDDIIDIMIDEKVLPQDDEAAYKQIIALRDMLVRNYLTIDHEAVDRTFWANKAKLDQFSTHTRHYLNNELGVANAFSN